MKKHTKNPILLLFRKIKLAIIQVYRAKGSPHEIALGVAIGAFWGVFPTFGLSTPLILVLYRFIHFNIITAFAGALVSNPLTSPFLLWISYKVGSIFFTPPQNIKDILSEKWWEKLQDVGLIMLVGATIVSTIVAVLAYFIALKLTKKRTPNLPTQA